MKELVDGTKVEVHYSGTLTSGEEFDSSRGKEPLAFTIGRREVLAGFETAVKKLEVGEKTNIELSPEEAYGDYRQELVLSVPKNNFPPQTPTTPGTLLTLRNPDGEEIMAVIDEVRDDMIQLNANHPLAGQTLLFEIELISTES